MVIGHSENMDTEGTYGHEKAGDLELAAQYIETAFDKVLGSKSVLLSVLSES